MNANWVVQAVLVAAMGVAALPVQVSAAEAVVAGVSDGGIEEIVVTARKREETSLAVPVVLTAISGKELENRGVYSVDTLARLVPALISGEGGGSTQGGNIVLRGISGADANPLADQAVAFNIDGLQVAKASVRRLAEMDLAQVEVLKGPQALFFGKNSPGGIISMRTADPTRQFESTMSTGYEFVAHEIIGEGYVAGPLTEDLGGRFAVYVSNMNGWMSNNTPAGLVTSPVGRRLPHDTDLAFRGTLVFDHHERFKARLKTGYSRSENSGPESTKQYVGCSGGTSFSNPGAECRVDSNGIRGDIGPNFHNLANPGYPADGAPFAVSQQSLGSLEMNYELNNDLQLTSVTGIYHLDYIAADQFNDGYSPSIDLPSRPILITTEISEEVRLQSNFTGPINFLVGGIYGHSHDKTGAIVWRNAIAPAYINDFIVTQKGHAESGFAQLRYNIIPQVELTAGARYSSEDKELTQVAARPTGLAPYQDYKTPQTTEHFTNLSPEYTIAYRPTALLTVFSSYKKGFLSGGFNAASSSPNGLLANLVYPQQTIVGEEVGVKALLFDRKLRTNLAYFDYNIKNMQIAFTAPGTTNQIVTNAGKVNSRGVEGDFTYATPLTGLDVTGALAWTRARYLVDTIGCFKGQTAAQGCIFPPRPGGTQDLKGHPVDRAPNYAGNLGLSYDRPVGSGLKIGLTGGVTYSGSYYTDAQNNPLGRVPNYTMVDAGLRLATINDRLEVALIGIDLNDKYYWTRSNVQPVGLPPAGPGSVNDVGATVTRGREVILKLTYKFGA